MAKNKKNKKANKGSKRPVKAKKGRGSKKTVIKTKATKGKKAKSIAKAKAAPKEKALGKIDHYFDKISVAAIKVTAPFKVGEIIHIKGHTTDFVQRVDSMQIEHQSIEKAKKGDDIGMKVKDFVRGHDIVYLSNEKALAADANRPKVAKPVAVQQPMFPGVKPVVKGASALPINQPKQETAPKQIVPGQKKPAGYSEKKFFSF